MIRVAICDDDIVFTTRVEEMILDFGKETVLILFLWI